jgi:lysozyme family protein
MNFEDVIDDVIAREKGFVDHPNDRGGPTNWGITQATAAKWGYTGAMQNLPVSVAREIYRDRYIAAPKFDKVAEIDEGVGRRLVDAGVLMGPARVSPMFQEWLNAFNMQGSRYADVFVDGRIGSVTLSAFRAYRRWRGAEGAEVMRYAIACSQGGHFLQLAKSQVTQEDFIYGWMLQRVVTTLKEGA